MREKRQSTVTGPHIPNPFEIGRHVECATCGVLQHQQTVPLETASSGVEHVERGWIVVRRIQEDEIEPYSGVEPTQDPGNLTAVNSIALLHAALRQVPPDEPGRTPMEGPRREVTVPDFFISRYPVTQAQYAALIGHNQAQSRVDNNPVENAIRGIALGRKNWLFAGSEGGGHRAALFYTLIESAKLNGVGPHAYLTHVFEQLPSATSATLDALLPWNFEPSSTTNGVVG